MLEPPNSKTAVNADLGIFSYTCTSIILVSWLPLTLVACAESTSFYRLQIITVTLVSYLFLAQYEGPSWADGMSWCHPLPLAAQLAPLEHPPLPTLPVPAHADVLPAAHRHVEGQWCHLRERDEKID